MNLRSYLIVSAGAGAMWLVEVVEFIGLMDAMEVTNKERSFVSINPNHTFM